MNRKCGCTVQPKAGCVVSQKLFAFPILSQFCCNFVFLSTLYERCAVITGCFGTRYIRVIVHDTAQCARCCTGVSGGDSSAEVSIFGL